MQRRKLLDAELILAQELLSKVKKDEITLNDASDELQNLSNILKTKEYSLLLSAIKEKKIELNNKSKAQKINSYSKLFDCYVDNKFEGGNLPKSVVSRISKFNTLKSNDEKLSYACIKLEIMAGIESLKKDLESRKSIQLEMLTNKFNKSSNDLNSLDDLIIHFFENLAVKEIKTADKNLWKRIIKSIEAILAN